MSRPDQNTMIEVDIEAAEILRRAASQAHARGQSLGAYLRQSLTADAVDQHTALSQREAWDQFIRGMRAHVEASVPKGYVADDSREAMYDDRS